MKWLPKGLSRLAAFFLASLPVAALLAGSAGPAFAAAAAGDPLPSISLSDTATGQPVEVGTLMKGSVGALVYMQTSCAACRKELMALKDLQAKYPKLKVVVVAVDSGAPERVVNYREHFGLDFPFLHDPEFKTPDLFGFSFTPGLVLVGKDGKVAQIKGGYRPGDEVDMEAKIVALTAQ
jgi:peroxiredoxin